MAVESRRGCGYRKVGGLYLVADGNGVSCCRLPIELNVCPCCGGGIKQSRGWTWINPVLMFGEVCKPKCNSCPAGNPALLGDQAGLLWVGEQFYKTADEFNAEAGEIGISKRIAAIPRNFKLGETWVLLAHPKAVKVEVKSENDLIPHIEYRPGVFRIFRPERLEKIITETMAKDKDEMQRLEKAGITPVIVPDDDVDHMGSVYDKPEDDELVGQQEDLI